MSFNTVSAPSAHPTLDPQRDFAIERFVDAPVELVWKALTTPQHIATWYMPQQWGKVVHTELDLRPGGIFRIDIAINDGPVVENVGCVLDAQPLQRLVWTSMLFPDYRPAVFDDVPITAIMTMEPSGTGTRYVFTALHRTVEDCEANKTSGFYDGTQVAIDQFVECILALK